MSVQAILAVVFFAVLFVAWVILPTRLKKRHVTTEEDEAVE